MFFLSVLLVVIPCLRFSSNWLELTAERDVGTVCAFGLTAFYFSMVKIKFLVLNGNSVWTFFAPIIIKTMHTQKFVRLVFVELYL